LSLNANGGYVGIGTVNPSTSLHVVGQIYATDDIFAFSDARYKKDIVTIENALDKVCSLNGVMYTNTDNQRRTGLLAQDVQKVLPEAVEEDSDGKLRLAYQNLIGLLVESIKELKTRLDETEKLLKSKE
jgi:hypothetical protein